MKKIALIAALFSVQALCPAGVFAAETTQKSQEELSGAILETLTLTTDGNQYIAKKDANVRIGPNRAFDIAGVVHSGDVIQSIGRARTWIAFEKGSKTVFIWEGLLNKWKAWPTSTTEAVE